MRKNYINTVFMSILLASAGAIQTDGSRQFFIGFEASLERTVRPEPVEGQSRKFPDCELQVHECPYFDRIKVFLKLPFALKVLPSIKVSDNLLR